MARRDIYKDGVATRFKPQGEIPPGAKIAKRPLTVRVLEEVDTVIRSLPEPSAWLRRVITEAAERELLGESPGTGSENPPPPLDADTLVQVLTEVLAVPRLPATARAKLQDLLERITSQ